MDWSRRVGDIIFLINTAISKLNAGCCSLVIILLIGINTTAETASEAYANGDYKKAEKLYQTEIKTSFAPGISFYNRGNCFMQMNEISKAVICWENALMEMPEFSPALYNLASIYFREKDYPSALVKLNIALENDPYNSKLLLMKFFCLKELGVDGEAVVTLEKIVDTDTSFVDGWFLFAEYESKLFDYTAAIDLLKNYPDMGKRNSEKYYNLAMLYENVNLFNDALYCLERAESCGFNTAYIIDSKKRILNKMGLRSLEIK